MCNWESGHLTCPSAFNMASSTYTEIVIWGKAHSWTECSFHFCWWCSWIAFSFTWNSACLRTHPQWQAHLKSEDLIVITKYISCKILFLFFSLSWHWPWVGREINLGLSNLCIREFIPHTEAVSEWVDFQVWQYSYRNAVHCVVHFEMHLPYTLQIKCFPSNCCTCRESGWSEWAKAKKGEFEELEVYVVRGTGSHQN